MSLIKSELNMAEFFEKIPTGTPKLPENYWEAKTDEKNEVPINNIFDKNLKASMDDISIFNKKREP